MPTQHHPNSVHPGFYGGPHPGDGGFGFGACVRVAGSGLASPLVCSCLTSGAKKLLLCSCLTSLPLRCTPLVLADQPPTRTQEPVSESRSLKSSDSECAGGLSSSALGACRSGTFQTLPVGVEGVGGGGGGRRSGGGAEPVCVLFAKPFYLRNKNLFPGSHKPTCAVSDAACIYGPSAQAL